MSNEDFSVHCVSNHLINQQSLAILPSPSFQVPVLQAPIFIERPSLYCVNEAISLTPYSTAGVGITLRQALIIPTINVCSEPPAWSAHQPLVLTNPPFACQGALLAANSNVIPLTPATISPVGLNMLANMDTLQVQVGDVTAISLSQAQQELVEATIHLPLSRPSHLPKGPYALVNYLLDWHDAMYALLVNPLPVLSRPLNEAKRLLAVFFKCLEAVVGNALKAIQMVHDERTRAVFRRQMRRTVIFKALHKPLQVIRESIRPIEAAA